MYAFFWEDFGCIAASKRIGSALWEVVVIIGISEQQLQRVPIVRRIRRPSSVVLVFV